MTVIIGLEQDDKVYIGGDGVASAGSLTNKITNPKVFIKKPMIIGFCHSLRMGQLLRYSLKIPPHPHGKDAFDYLTTNFISAVQSVLAKNGFFDLDPAKIMSCFPFLVGYRGKIYEVNGDFGFIKYEKKYCAIGAGTELALGSLHSTETLIKNPEKRIIMALEAASSFEASVGPPFTIVKL